MRKEGFALAQLIYVIEDDESIRALLEAALTSEGYEVRGFANAAPALKEMSARRPALVIFDIMLEGMDGITALKLMRQKPELLRTKALMLTAKDTEGDKVTGLDAGADDYMTKPFSVLELCARVRALLRRAGEEGPALQLSLIHIWHQPAGRHAGALGHDPALHHQRVRDRAAGGAPRARLASSYSGGTARSAVSDTLMMEGRIMTESTSMAASRLVPLGRPKTLAMRGTSTDTPIRP